MISTQVTGRVREVITKEHKGTNYYSVLVDARVMKWDSDAKAEREANAPLLVKLWGRAAKRAPKLAKGQLIELKGNAESREYKDSWFTDVNADTLIVLDGAGARDREPGDDDDKIEPPF